MENIFEALLLIPLKISRGHLSTFDSILQSNEQSKVKPVESIEQIALLVNISDLIEIIDFSGIFDGTVISIFILNAGSFW